MRWADGDEVRASVHRDLPAIKAALTAAYPEIQFSTWDYGWSVSAARERKGVHLAKLYYVNPETTKMKVAEESDIPRLIELLA